ASARAVRSCSYSCEGTGVVPRREVESCCAMAKCGSGAWRSATYGAHIATRAPGVGSRLGQARLSWSWGSPLVRTFAFLGFDLLGNPALDLAVVEQASHQGSHDLACVDVMVEGEATQAEVLLAVHEDGVARSRAPRSPSRAAADGLAIAFGGALTCRGRLASRSARPRGGRRRGWRESWRRGR